jgi:hypothetical protein
VLGISSFHGTRGNTLGSPALCVSGMGWLLAILACAIVFP